MFLCVLFPSLHSICCSRGASHGLASGSVCFKWLSADFDRLIQKKRRNDYAWLPKRVVSKNYSQLSCGTLHRFSGAYCRGFASVAFFALSCSCGHLLNSRILETPDPPTTRFNVAVSLTQFFVYPNDFTAYHCLLNSKGNIFDQIKNAE